MQTVPASVGVVPLTGPADRATFYATAGRRLPAEIHVTPAVEALLYSVWCQRQAIDRAAADLFQAVTDVAARHSEMVDTESAAIDQALADNPGVFEDNVFESIFEMTGGALFDAYMALAAVLLYDGGPAGGVPDEHAYRQWLASVPAVEPRAVA